ncbi:hypothetical protein, partial [Planktothrix sp.]|uniref:hypothetical protein n=1 Tax=Planktothrix sp. TaxID=3088171 RepID=UPI0038D43EB9
MFNPLLNPTQGIQLSTSLFSLKLYLFPYIPCHIVIYTLPEYISSIEVICNLFEIPASSYSFISLTDEEDQRFSESIQHASTVDRICIRRMLADFR